METAERSGSTAGRSCATPEQPPAALLLAAFAAAATVSADSGSSTEAADGESSGGDRAAIAWLDHLNADLLSDLQRERPPGDY